MIGGGIVAIVGGLFLPWVSVSAPLLGSVDIYGAPGDGQIVALAGVLGIIGGSLVMTGRRDTAAKILGVLAVLGIALVAISDFPDLAESAGEFDFGRLGTGIYAVVLGGVGLVVGTGTLLNGKLPEVDGGSTLGGSGDKDRLSERTRRLMESEGLTWTDAWKRASNEPAVNDDVDNVTKLRRLLLDGKITDDEYQQFRSQLDD